MFFGLGGGAEFPIDKAAELLLRDVTNYDFTEDGGSDGGGVDGGADGKVGGKVEDAVGVEDDDVGGDEEVADFFQGLQNHVTRAAQETSERAEPTKPRAVEPVWFAEALAQRSVDLGKDTSADSEVETDEDRLDLIDASAEQRALREAESSQQVTSSDGPPEPGPAPRTDGSDD